MGNKNFLFYIQGLVNDYLGLEAKTGGNSVLKNNEFIEALPLPDAMISAIRENNNDVMYTFFKATGLNEYISKYVTTMIINFISIILVFIIVFIIIICLRGIIEGILDNFSILSYLDSIGGGILGFFIGLIFVWLVVVIIMLFMPDSEFIKQAETAFTKVLIIDYNVILNMIFKIF